MVAKPEKLDEAALDGVMGGAGWQPPGPDATFAEGDALPPAGTVPFPCTQGGDDGEVSPEAIGKRIVF